MGNKVSWLSSSVFHENINPDAGHLLFRIPQLMLSEGRYTFNLYCEVDGMLADWVQDVGQLDVAFHDYYGNGHRIPDGQGPMVMQYSVEP